MLLQNDRTTSLDLIAESGLQSSQLYLKSVRTIGFWHFFDIILTQDPSEHALEQSMLVGLLKDESALVAHCSRKFAKYGVSHGRSLGSVLCWLENWRF